MVYTHGNLDLNTALGTKTQGCFDKWNLDSSGDFCLGGPNGVRAYPIEEGFDDAGWLAQIEARYPTGSIAPYALYDSGI